MFVKSVHFILRSGVGYQCLGDMSEWTKCTNKTDDPERKPFVVPDEFKEQVKQMGSS